MRQYVPYKPTRWEQRVDKAVGLVAPSRQFKRLVDRERAHYFRYLAAQPNSARRNANPNTSGENLRGAYEKQQVMWNAINMIDNSGLGSSIIGKLQSYVIGQLRFQSRCGDKVIANEYEDAMRIKLTNALDLTGRFSLRQMCMLDVKAVLVKGDVGTNIVRAGSEIYLQGIEADRIGDPYRRTISQNYVRGLELDDNGIVQAARIFVRNRLSGYYKYDKTLPMRSANGMPAFLFMVNPLSYDDYRGVSSFHTAVDLSTFIDRMREYELMAMLWASSQSGVYHTKSGELPEKLPFDKTPIIDSQGNTIDTYEVRPNTVTALGVGEDVVMFPHERPSPNVVSMFHDTQREICIGAGVSYAFGCGYDELTGPGVRAVSNQDARAIEMWQLLLREIKLDPVMTLVLGNDIANGVLPYHPNWRKWEWFFPPKSSIDAGRESAANIEEINAWVNTGAKVAADDGQDIDAIREQRGAEIQGEIEIAMQIAKEVSKGQDQPVPWQAIYQLMKPTGKGGGGFGSPMAPSPDGPGVTSDGVKLEDGRNGDSGSKKNFQDSEVHSVLVLDPRTGTYREYAFDPNEPRDELGRWTDIGGGASSGNGATTTQLVPKIHRETASHTAEFFSPNEGEMNFGDALKAMHGDSQQKARKIGDDIDSGLGLKGVSHDGIGDWDDGAENSVFHEIDNAKDFDQLRYSAALKGKALNQKAVLAFSADEKGADAIHSMTLPTNDLEGVRDRLTKAGVQFRTILPDGANTHIVVFDQGNKLGDKIEDVAKQYGDVTDKFEGINVNTVTGKGEFVGESDTREGAAKNYDSIISGYEKSHPEGRYKPVQGQVLHDNGSKVAKPAKVRPGSLDKQIADYKPNRSISDPRKTERIAKLFPGVQYTPYSKTPFFNRVNVLQGMGDEGQGKSPLRFGVGEYVKARDEVFDTIPVTKVALDNVVVTQERVNKDRVQKMIDKPKTRGAKAIQAVRYDGKTYILNGHHRVAAAIEEGKDKMNAHVLDLDHPDPVAAKNEADIPRYVRELRATPEYKTVENRLRALGATNGQREGWSLRQNTTDGSENPNKLTPERKALHEKIIEKFLNPKAVPPAGQRPQAIYLIGKPGSGKTHSSAEELQHYGEVTNISCDTIRAELPEYRGWNTPATQAESREIANDLIDRAVSAGQNILFDEVGANADKLAIRTKALGSPEIGYDVNVIHVNAPLEQVAKTIWDRFKDSGRYTDMDFLLKGVDHRPDNSYKVLKKMPEVKTWKEIDNKDYSGKITNQGSRK